MHTRSARRIQIVLRKKEDELELKQHGIKQAIVTERDYASAKRRSGGD
jgi:hypothetical protein